MQRTFLTVGLLTVWCAAGLGCTNVRNAAQRIERSNDLKAVGVMYTNFCDDNKGKPPSRVEDLQKYREDELLKKAYDRLAGGEYVVLWDRKATPQTSPPVMIAYFKDVPAAGGPVLMSDLSVQQIKADEFEGLRGKP